MALANGVLVHGPTAWGCAVRLDDGTMRIASGRKRQFAPSVQTPFVRGPLRLAEAFALLPDVRRRLPAAQMPFQRPAVVSATVAAALIGGAARKSRLSAGFRELVAGLATLAPAVVALRGADLASYHGAEHISIGTYEQDGERATKEHERCGSHLVGPLLVTSAVASALTAGVSKRARPAARLAATVGAVGASVELFGWMTRHPDRRLARALALPGYELQARVSTAEPSEEQLRVAEAALAACLELEEVP
jgi:uncharacterized protein YqhQ